MCTLLLAWRVFGDAPVVVAANRDEATDRPATPPRRWDRGAVPFVAPRDEEAGGTWIGHNEAGLFVGISNRWGTDDLSGERSRGLLVADLLGAGGTAEATAHLSAALDTHAYEGFNLLLADADAAALVEWDGELHVSALEPGVHVLMNAGFDHAFREPETRREPARRQAEAAGQVLEAAKARRAETWADWLDRAATILADHEIGICVHGDGYGTRSAALIGLPSAGDPTFRYADGPPCTTAFEPIEGQS